MRWAREQMTPGILYKSEDGRYTIIWDPGGPSEDAPPGLSWCLSELGEDLGWYRTLREAKAAVEA